MAKLFVIFTLVFCVSGWATVAPYDGFSPVNLSSSYGQKTQNAKNIAIEYMTKYKSFLVRNNHHSIAAVINSMIFSLTRAQLWTSDYSSHENDNFRCRNNGGGLVNLLDPIRLYLCAITRSDNTQNIVQIILHESYHLHEASNRIIDSKNISEYNASRYEVGILESNGKKCVPFKTQYHDGIPMNSDPNNPWNPKAPRDPDFPPLNPNYC